jgi:tripartite-type tricarboxylate transporter receptor subunit TctC
VNEVEKNVIRLIRILLALFCLAPASMPADAQTYPSFPARPVRIVVAFPPGGAADLITRAVAQRLATAWRQRVVVENRGGGGTQIGTEHVAGSEADGYTLLATAQGTFAINPYIYRNLSYDVNAFTAVSGMGMVNQVLVMSPAVPLRSIKEMIAYAKGRPGELNYGTVGPGTSGRLNMEMFQSMAGVKLNSAQYQGGALVLSDIIRGLLPMGFVSLAAASQPLKVLELRPLGVGGAARSAQFPAVPTIAEAGLNGFNSSTWFGLFAPRSTPLPVVGQINADVQRVLADPSFQSQFLTPNFFDPIGGTPREFAGFVRGEAEKWSTVLRDTKLSVE